MAARCPPSSMRSPRSPRSRCGWPAGGGACGGPRERCPPLPFPLPHPCRRRRSKRSRVADADGLLEMFHCPYEGCNQVYVALSSFQVGPPTHAPADSLSFPTPPSETRVAPRPFPSHTSPGLRHRPHPGTSPAEFWPWFCPVWGDLAQSLPPQAETASCLPSKYHFQCSVLSHRVQLALLVIVNEGMNELTRNEWSVAAC